MAITGEELEKYYIKKITIQNIKCECKNKEEVLKAINRAIDTANAIALAITGEDVAKKILEIQNNAEKTIDTRYPGMIGIFPKALTDVYFRLLEIAFSYAKDSLDQFSNKYLKLWTSTSFKGLTPQLINDTAKTLEKTHSRSIESYTKQLEKDSKSIVDGIIQKYMNDFDKTIDRKLKQIQAKINNEIKLLESWVSVWNPGGSFSNISDDLKELLKITKSGKGALSQKQITSLDDLLQEPTRTHSNTRGYMKTIPENSPTIKEITDQETKRIVILYMNMVTEDSTEKQNFAKSYIESKFSSAIKSNIKLLENLKKQLISVAEKSARDASVATNLINLCGAVTRLINIISPQPMKGKLDKNDITLIKQLIWCTHRNYKFTNKIPEIDLPCLKDMPTKCLMLDIIKLVEQNVFTNSTLNIIVANYLRTSNEIFYKPEDEKINSITKKDLKIGIFSMPSTKKKFVEDINKQIKQFAEFIKKQKSEIIKQRDEKIGKLSVLETYKGNPILKKIEDVEFEKFAKDMQQHISRLKNAFKTKYLNKWTKNKKAFEADCVISNGLRKWEQDLINDFEPTFVDQFSNNLESEIKKSAKDELCSIAKEVSSKIKPYKEICLDMFDFIASNVNPGYFNQEKRNAILDFLNWIETQAQAKSNFGVSPSSFEKQNDIQNDSYCLLSGISLLDLDDLYQKEDFVMPNFFRYCCSTGASSTTIALLMFLQSQVSSSPIPNRNAEFEKPCNNINETLLKYLKNIANNRTTCQTWENYGKNEKFKTLFNGFIDALGKDEPISSDTAALMEFFIDDGFNVKNDYNVPEFISKSWHDKNTRKVILGMKQLYLKGRPIGAQAVLENLAKNIDANAEKHSEALEKFLGIDKSKTQEEQEQEQPQKQPNQNKSTTQKPKQAPTAKPKNKGAGPFVPHQNTRPAAARNRRKK